MPTPPPTLAPTAVPPPRVTRPAAPPASRTALVRRARRIDRELALLYPDAHCELDFTTPLELLVATILSAQCTDKRVNVVTPVLFARYRTAADYAGADRGDLEKIIQSYGLLPGQDDQHHRARPGPVRPVRRRGAAAAERPGHAAGRRPQDGERRARQRLRHPRHHRRHALRPAVAPLRLDRRGRPGQGRARGRGAVPALGVDDPVAPADLARPPGLPRPPAGLRGVRHRRAVPVVRRGPDRPGAGRRSWSRRARSRDARQSSGRRRPARRPGLARPARRRGRGRCRSRTAWRRPPRAAAGPRS